MDQDDDTRREAALRDARRAAAGRPSRQSLAIHPSNEKSRVTGVVQVKALSFSGRSRSRICSGRPDAGFLTGFAGLASPPPGIPALCPMGLVCTPYVRLY